MILSASRRTDLPRWYSDWLLARLRAGYALTRNPVVPSQISRVPLTPDVVDCIVFWTKDPLPLLPKLSELDRMGYRYYFQFTLTPYGRDIEPGLRDKPAIEDTFLELSRALGRERVLWRYDPILLNDTYTEAWHQAEFARMCGKLSPFTESVTISFLDLYAKLKSPLLRAPAPDEIARLSRSCAETAGRYGLTIQACAEPGDLTSYGVKPAACIDRDLIQRLCGHKMDLKPDKGQRPGCGCCESVDIGAYDTCKSGCVYCYACYGRPLAAHDPSSGLLTGQVREGEAVRERPCRSNILTQESLW